MSNIEDRLYSGKLPLCEFTTDDILALFRARRLDYNGKVGIGMPVLMRHEDDVVRIVEVRSVPNSNDWLIRVLFSGKTYRWFRVEGTYKLELGGFARRLARSAPAPIFLSRPPEVLRPLVTT